MLLRLLLVLTLSIMPAQATNYLVFEQNDNRSHELWTDTEPVPGKDVPSTSKVRVFAPLPDENGNPDTDYRNYILITGGLRRVVEKPVANAKAQPNIDGFFASLAASPAFTDDEIIQALRCKMIVDKDMRDQAILKYAACLPQEKIGILLQLAKENNIDLPL